MENDGEKAINLVLFFWVTKLKMVLVIFQNEKYQAQTNRGEKD